MAAPMATASVAGSPMNRQVRAQLGKIKDQLTQWHASIDPPTRAQIEAAKWDLDLLLFLSTPREGWKLSAPPTIHSPICAEPGCKAGWREGLINYAQPENDPVWYCKRHAFEPEVGGHAPAGTLPPVKALHDKAVEMAGRWTVFEKTLAKQIAAEEAHEKFDWREQ